MGFYRLAWPLIRVIDAERAHRFTISLLQRGLPFPAPRSDHPALRVRAFGLDFPNPIGLAAGFDKNAEVPDAMLKLGFGFVEVGSITPRPQEGNPRPRLFRLIEDRAVINRMGFNNEGHAAAEGRLLARRGRVGIVGVNLGANKDSTDRTEDYVIGLKRFGAVADYLVINVSSPNTPGLRALQGEAELDELLGRLAAAAADLPRRLPLLLKIAPDLVAADRETIASTALKHRLDGLIVSNTTIARPTSLRGVARMETGGLSGQPLFEASTAVLADMYRLTRGQVTLVGVGGISSGADAMAKIKAGATLVQLYSALVFEGPGLVGRIKHDLLRILQDGGFRDVGEAVGADVR